MEKEKWKIVAEQKIQAFIERHFPGRPPFSVRYFYHEKEVPFEESEFFSGFSVDVNGWTFKDYRDLNALHWNPEVREEREKEEVNDFIVSCRPYDLFRRETEEKHWEKGACCPYIFSCDEPSEECRKVLAGAASPEFYWWWKFKFDFAIKYCYDKTDLHSFCRDPYWIIRRKKSSQDTLPHTSK